MEETKAQGGMGAYRWALQTQLRLMRGAGTCSLHQGRELQVCGLGGRPLPYSAHKHTCMCTNINAHLHLHTHTHVHPHRSHLCIHICNAHQVCTLVWRAQRHTSPHEQVSAGTCRPTTCALTRTPLGAPAPTHAHVSGGRSHSVHMNFEAERTQRRLMLWKRMDSDTHIRPTQPC